MTLNLRPHQIEALDKLHNGSVLKGDVGTGKSRVAVAYFYEKEAGGLTRSHRGVEAHLPETPKDVYVITTAKKRKELDWFGEFARVGIVQDNRVESAGEILLTVDSWNNIHKYAEVKDAFFIFDEQRLVGSGAWVKAFLKIAKANNWILLSATPGDSWMDYVPIFVANGFYKNRTEMLQTHAVWRPKAPFPQVERWIETSRLRAYRDQLLVYMPMERHTTRHVDWVSVDHNKELFKRVSKDRWNVFTEEPVKDIGELFRVMRKLVNTDLDRISALMKLMEKHKKLIVFYNFNYELDILRTLSQTIGIQTHEYNGQKHEPVPEGDEWLYLVQYTAGAEGWNCITTDAMVFWSLNYSYKIFEQSKGRIDRLNTPFNDLWYYVFRSNSTIDNAIAQALAKKQNFNEKDYVLSA